MDQWRLDLNTLGKVSLLKLQVDGSHLGSHASLRQASVGESLFDAAGCKYCLVESWQNLET